MLVNSKYSAFSLAKSCYKEEGILGFYKGLLTPLISFSIINGFTLSLNEVSKNLLGSHDDSKMTIKTSFISGLFVGAAMYFIFTPTDLIKCKLQIQNNDVNKKYNNIRHMVFSILKKEGIKGLYLGGTVTLIKETIINSTYFGIYHTIKVLLSKVRNKDFNNLGSADFAIAGSLAGSISFTIIHPFEVSKTLIQTGKILNNNTKELNKTIFVDEFHSTKIHTLYRYKSIFKDGGTINSLKHIYLSNGFLYLYRGLSICIFQTSLENGFMFVIFEKLKKNLNEFYN